METLSYGQDQPTTPTAEGIVLHGTYRLVSQLGYGGMGVVYEAVHTRLPGRFAVKVLLRNLMAYPEAMARFAREAEIMSELRHPHVVQIVDFNVTEEQQPYFVMEYLDGRDLETELGERGRMPLRETVSMINAIASALGVAHRRGIVHRDLKPSNIFLCDVEGWQEPFVKVLDFGISKILTATRTATRSGSRITRPDANLVGTPHYMAPEQATGAGEEIDGRTDQFALAAMAYAMLTGHDAFEGDDQVSVLYQIVHEQPRPMARWATYDCAGVQDVLFRALSKRPADRFETITEFASALTVAAANVAGVEVSAGTDAPTAMTAMTAMTGTASSTTSNPTLMAPETVEPSWEITRSPSALDVTQVIDRVPRAPYRAVLLALIALCLVGVIIAKGWMRELPDDVAITYRGLVDRINHRAPLPQPAAHAAGSVGLGIDVQRPADVLDRSDSH